MIHPFPLDILIQNLIANACFRGGVRVVVFCSLVLFFVVVFLLFYCEGWIVYKRFCVWLNNLRPTMLSEHTVRTRPRGVIRSGFGTVNAGGEKQTINFSTRVCVFYTYIIYIESPGIMIEFKGNLFPCTFLVYMRSKLIRTLFNM